MARSLSDFNMLRCRISIFHRRELFLRCEKIHRRCQAVSLITTPLASCFQSAVTRIFICGLARGLKPALSAATLRRLRARARARERAGRCGITSFEIAQTGNPRNLTLFASDSGVLLSLSVAAVNFAAADNLSIYKYVCMYV